MGTLDEGRWTKDAAFRLQPDARTLRLNSLINRVWRAPHLSKADKIVVIDAILDRRNRERKTA